MRVPFVTADVFTDQQFGGNPLAVIPDAGSIPEPLLLAITREFNFSETTFVFPARDAAHTRRVRIFTPGGELPFAGHPTVGTAHVLCATGLVSLTGDETRLVLEEGVGPVPVTVRSRDGRPHFAELTVARLPEVGPPPPSRHDLATVLGLPDDALLDGPMAPEVVSCGVPFLFVPVRDRAAVAAARVNVIAWEHTFSGFATREIFVFALDPELPGSQVRARMFAPGLGVGEDPATGSAVAALGGYLGSRARRGNDTLRWRVEQGFEMGRPSILDLTVDRNNGRVSAVRVGGASVIVTRGELDLP